VPIVSGNPSLPRRSLTNPNPTTLMSPQQFLGSKNRVGSDDIQNPPVNALTKEQFQKTLMYLVQVKLMHFSAIILSCFFFLLFFCSMMSLSWRKYTRPTSFLFRCRHKINLPMSLDSSKLSHAVFVGWSSSIPFFSPFFFSIFCYYFTYM